MTWEIWQIFSRAIKIGILMWSFNPNLKKYELQIHRGVIYHDNEELCKIWTGTDLSFQSWHEEFDEFWLEHLKVSKVFILMGCKVYIVWAKKVQRSYLSWNWRRIQKLWEKSTCRFKIGIRIWQILTRALKNLKDFCFNGLLLSKVYIAWTKKVERSYLSWHWRAIQNLKKNWLAAWKMTGIWQIFTRALESVKTGALMRSFCPK